MATDKTRESNNLDAIADSVFSAVSNSVSDAKALQKRKVAENVQIVIQALKKIESDLQDKYDGVTTVIEKRVASIKNGQDGRNGVDGKAGKDGRPGRDGATGPRGADGLNGRDGRDGMDGVSVTDARIDFDGSLVISLSSGREINVGEVVAPDLAERIKVITNGGGTSQGVLDAIAALQATIATYGTMALQNANAVNITGGTVNPTTLREGGVAAVVQTDIGTAPNEIPLNQYLGNLAYQDAANIAGPVNIGGAATINGNLQMISGANVVWAPAPASISAAATLTNANIQSQIIVTTGASPFTLTMPLGTTLETLISWSTTNLGYDFTIINTASDDITVAVNTGVTAVGLLVIPSFGNTSAQFRIRRTAANTFVLYRLS